MVAGRKETNDLQEKGRQVHSKRRQRWSGCNCARKSANLMLREVSVEAFDSTPEIKDRNLESYT